MSWPSRNLGCCFDPSRDPAKVAIIDLRQPDRPEEVTYAALNASCDAVARGLLAKGLKQGDRVGIMSQNSAPLISAYLGIMRAGMVPVPISFKLARETVEYIIRDADLRAVFHDHDRAALVPNHLLSIDFDNADGYAALLDYGPFTAFEPKGRDIATILYTSGSTGMPKGVLLSHESQMWALDAAARAGDRSHHRYIVAAPMFHMNATISVKTALHAGASMVLLPLFDARLYAQAIAKYRVTWLTSVPTMMAMLARERDLLAELDFSSVTNVMMGSAPLTKALVEKVQSIFPGAAISNAYGTTEAGPGVFGPHPDGLPRPDTALGFPVEGALAELREGPSPDEGVLYMKSPMLMQGYNNRPDKTAEVMRDGWYRSGDIMRRDENGFFHFLGRADDMFVVGGENVWPGEVEKLVERMPGVHQAAVVPVPDEIKGTLPFAFVVPQEGAKLDEAAIKKFTIDHGPAFSHPRFVEFRSAIPLSGTNKPDRRLLTQEAEVIAARRRLTGERAR
jgi:long-chain acyl-CoA synthetase